MRCKIRFIVLGVILLLQFGILPGWAADISWEKMPYAHYSEKEKLKDLLADFFSTQGIGLVCSENVKDTISGQFNTDDPQRFFEEMAQVYNLVWYYDGAAVFIYSAHEMTSRILNLGYINMNAFKNNLEQLGIIDRRFGLNMVPADRIVFVSGPPRYVQLVAELAEKLDEKAMSRRGRDDIINVFPLKHAWADDKTLYFHERELVIPGVVTLLNNLITGQTAPGQVVGSNKHEKLVRNVSKLKGQGLSRKRNHASSETAANSDAEVNVPISDTAAQVDIKENESSSKPYPPAFTDRDLGVIQADSRQNAVVVRDREEKMPYYERIIALLDVPVGLVEIRATIMDVNRNDIQNLGIEWQFTSTSSDNQSVTKGGLHSEAENYSAEDGLLMPLGQGFNIATIIGDSRNFFLSKVNALQEEGHAKILSRPSVLTLNNMEAQLEHSKTFYVRVEGEEEVDLFDVTAGVVLRVTPHIIEDQKNNHIKLAIQIEDGDFNFSDDTVDNIPVVQNSIINTQAVVGENESLLIGGYAKEETNNIQRQIPCLGDIPLLGWLFKTDSNAEENLERLFMITPKLVAYGSDSNELDPKIKESPSTHSPEDL